MGKTRAIIKQIIKDPESIIEGNLDNSTIGNMDVFSTSTDPLLLILKELINNVFGVANALLMTASYLLLIIQSAYILNSKQPKHINLRHIVIKWLLMYLLVEFRNGFVQRQEISSECIGIFIDIIILLIVYPSKVLNIIHLKYFSQGSKQKYYDSVSNPQNYDITFGQRLLISFIIFLLSFSKHMIAFVPPNFRKSIEQPIRDINILMIEKKCYWLMYEDNRENKEKENSKRALIQSLIPQRANIRKPAQNLSVEKVQTNSDNHLMNTSLCQSIFEPKYSIIKAFGQQCSSFTEHGYKPLKKVSLRYNPTKAQLSIVDLDFGKVQTFILLQVEEVDECIAQFRVKNTKPVEPINKKNSRSIEQQIIIIKFNNNEQLDSFMQNMEQFEGNT